MVCETTKNRAPLLPDRMQQTDFFVCDIFDAAPKGDMASMQHPIFSISTKPDMRRRRYESGDQFVEVRPSDRGIATVHDRDVLIFCISQVMAALNEGRKVERKMRFKAFDLLSATNRPTGGEAYIRLKDALERLSGTRVQTNIITGGEEVLDDFGLIDRFRIVRETRDGRMQEVEVELSDWVYNAIQHREVLTLHRDYFRLRKPLERRIYELARKHCGAKQEWKIGLMKLQEKCGSSSTSKEFRRLISVVVRQDEEYGHMPDYSVRMVDDVVIFTNRNTMPKPSSDVGSVSIPPLDGDTYDLARTLAPGWDVRLIEQEWRAWVTDMPRNPDKAFLGFCKSWYEKRGRP